MTFDKRSLRLARIIIHIFETSKPEGSPGTVAILDDGAGISYGINQATHKSGSLYAVVQEFVTEHPDAPYADVLIGYLPKIEDDSSASIARLGGDARLKAALKQAGMTPEMREVQENVFNRLYMQPAIKAAEGSGFALPLSLAVIYDSMNHGSWAKIRDRVTVKREGFESGEEFEKTWISTYVSRRDHWLESISRLKKTGYRTDFFLEQIRRGNWQLDPPMNVHGFKLTAKHVDLDESGEHEPEQHIDEPSKVDLHTPAPIEATMAKLEVREDVTKISAIPPFPVQVPDWAKKIVTWGATINFGGLGISFAFFRDNPQALSALLNILKWGFVGLVGVVVIIAIGVFVKSMWNAKLANDLNMARLHNYGNPDTKNVDFSGWKMTAAKDEVKF